MTRTSLMTANVAGRRSVPALAAALDMHRPHVLVVTEGARARGFLRGLPGYRLLPTYRGGTETGDVAVAVRHDIGVLHRWAMRMRRAWTGPLKGKRHSGRIYPIQRLRLPGGDLLRLAGVHFPTGGPHGPNRAAWTESARRLARWAQNNPGGPLVALGDFNAEASELAGLAGAVHAALIPGTKVDHALIRGGRARSVNRLAAPAGMHGWLIYDLEVSA